MEAKRCTPCLGTFVPASKICVQCETPMCDNHVAAHNNTVDHVLFDLNSSSSEWQCSEHKKVLNFYCVTENVAMCQTCYNNGEHSNHSVERLDAFAAKRKESLINDKENLKKIKGTKEKLIEKMKIHKRAQESIAQKFSGGVTHQVKDIMAQLTDIQRKVDNEIKRRKESVLLSVDAMTQQLEGENVQLNNKIELIEDLCAQNIFTFLNRVKEADVTEIQKITYGQIQNGTSNKAAISVMLHKELLQFGDRLTKRKFNVAFPKMEKSEITLDINTAHYKIHITDDLRSAVYKENRYTRDAGPERFRSSHVLSECRFSSWGNHYWEVKVKGTQCSIGVAYDNIDRKTTRRNSRIGYNESSWSLSVDSNLSMWHNHVETKISTDSPVRAFGIFLEYSVGCLSFYQLCDPIRHLHTFTTTFTRPLHAAFYVNENSKIKILP